MNQIDRTILDTLRATIPEADLLRAANAATTHSAADVLAAALARAGYEGPPSERPRYYVLVTQHYGNVIVRAVSEGHARAQLADHGVPENEIIDSGLSAEVPPRLAHEERATPITWGFDTSAFDSPDDSAIERFRQDASKCPLCGGALDYGDACGNGHDAITVDTTCVDCGAMIHESYHRDGIDIIPDPRHCAADGN